MQNLKCAFFIAIMCIFFNVVLADEKFEERKIAMEFWDELIEAQKRLTPSLYELGQKDPNRMTTPEQRLEFATEIQSFNQNFRPKIETVLQKVYSKFGEGVDRAELDKKYSEIFDKAPIILRREVSSPGSILNDFTAGLSGIDATAESLAQHLINQAEEELHSEYRSQNSLEYYRKDLATAKLLDADSNVNEVLKAIDSELASIKNANNDKINNNSFPQDYRNFAGPGDLEKLLQEAFDWLDNSPAWGKRIEPYSHYPVAVALKGDWTVVKRSATGLPTQWGLPIYAAVTNPEKEKDGIVRVFSLTAVGRETIDPQQGQKPPFVNVHVGDSWDMKISNLPNTGLIMEGESSFSSAPSGGTSYIFYWLQWILLVFLNIAGGALLFKPAFQNKIKHAIAPLGLTMFGLGSLFLLWSLVTINLLDNLLPIVSMVAIGNILLLEKLKVTKVEHTSTQGAHRLLICLGQVFIPFSDKVGVAAIAIGALHFSIGDWILF